MTEILPAEIDAVRAGEPSNCAASCCSSTPQGARRGADRGAAQGLPVQIAPRRRPNSGQAHALRARADAREADAMTARPPEAKRDLLETSFTPILRRIWSAMPSVLAAVFVDLEGECIDYVSSLDPFEAKVSAAHALVLVDAIRAARSKLGMRRADCAVDYGVRTRALGAAGQRRVRARAGALARRRITRKCGPCCRARVGNFARRWVPTRRVGAGQRRARGDRARRGRLGRTRRAAYTERGTRVVIADVLGRWIEALERCGGESVLLPRAHAGRTGAYTRARSPRARIGLARACRDARTLERCRPECGPIA